MDSRCPGRREIWETERHGPGSPGGYASPPPRARSPPTQKNGWEVVRPVPPVPAPSHTQPLFGPEPPPARGSFPLWTGIVVATRHHQPGEWRCPTSPLWPAGRQAAHTTLPPVGGHWSCGDGGTVARWCGGRAVVRCGQRQPAQGLPRHQLFCCRFVRPVVVRGKCLAGGGTQPAPPARVHLGVLRVGGRGGRLVALSPACHTPRA